MNKQIIKLFVTVFILVMSFHLFAQNDMDQVLMTIDEDEITVEDFLNVYRKNNINNEVIDKKSLEEYLDLFINFKLKVKEAEKLGLDTAKAFINELNGYRKQLAQPYMIDEELNNKLIQEAYERMQYDLRVSHILVRVEQNAPPADTLSAYNRIMIVRNKIVDEGRDFGEMAVMHSEDPSAKDRPSTPRQPFIKGNKGDLGYFTVFDMLYPFENGAYNTQPDNVSMPVKTNYGYHLIKVTDKENAFGTVQVAHILILLPKGASHEDSVMTHEKVIAAYDDIQNGIEFAEVVRKYSDDKGTVEKEGVLPKFGVNRMIPEFIIQIREIDEPGGVTEPFLTHYGWHIVKLLDRQGIGTFDENIAGIKQKIAKNDRAEQSKISKLEKLKDEYNFKQNLDNAYALVDVLNDSVFTKKWRIENAQGMNEEIFQFADKSFTQHDLANYIYTIQSNSVAKELDIFLMEKYLGFVEKSVFDYEDSQLENKYPEFKTLINEYRDGILLFELTDEMIWSKAIEDTTGLKEFYENNKDKYMWDERVDASVYTLTNAEFEKAIRKLAKKNTERDVILNTYNHDSEIILSIIRDNYQKGDNEYLDSIIWKQGITSSSKSDEKIVFAYIHEILPPQPKSLNEARGLITADYQTYLEQQWINELRSTHTVIVNEDVLMQIK